MTPEEFVAGDWIDRLARVLPDLAKVQEPYLQEYWHQNSGVHAVYGGQDGNLCRQRIARWSLNSRI